MGSRKSVACVCHKATCGSANNSSVQSSFLTLLVKGPIAGWDQQ